MLQRTVVPATLMATTLFCLCSLLPQQVTAQDYVTKSEYRRLETRLDALESQFGRILNLQERTLAALGGRETSTPVSYAASRTVPIAYAEQSLASAANMSPAFAQQQTGRVQITTYGSGLVRLADGNGGFIASGVSHGYGTTTRSPAIPAAQQRSQPHPDDMVRRRDRPLPYAPAGYYQGYGQTRYVSW